MSDFDFDLYGAAGLPFISSHHLFNCLTMFNIYVVCATDALGDLGEVRLEAPCLWEDEIDRFDGEDAAVAEAS